MLEGSKQEVAPAPFPTQSIKDFNNSVFFCFSINEQIYNKESFLISTTFNNLSYEEFRKDNFTVVRVYCSGLINMVKEWFTTKHSFNISYVNKKREKIFSSSKEYIAEKNKIKYIYDAGNNGLINSPFFSNPSCLEQYKTFLELINQPDNLFSETEKYLYENLDIELYLYLLESNEDKRQKLLKILDIFPYLKVIYKKDKSLQEINFESLSTNKNYNKLIIIYSFIQDSEKLLNILKDNDFDILFKYNEIHKDNPIIIKKNIFYFLFEKIDKLEIIKKICQNCGSIPLLFDYLINAPSHTIQKIKDLTINDLPNIDYQNDDLLELVQKYEKIKDVFKSNEIIKLWKKYLINLYKKKEIIELEKIMDKFISIDKNFYTNIIDEINTEIVKKGK